MSPRAFSQRFTRHPESPGLPSLKFRHPSSFRQRSLSLFISLGYNDAHLERIAPAQKERAALMFDALARHAPHCKVSPLSGGGSCWVQLPDNVPATELAKLAAERGALIEPGDVFFQAEQPSDNFIRQGDDDCRDATTPHINADRLTALT